MATDEQRIKILARQLGNHFNTGVDIGPCACSGFGCVEPSCSVWWEFFLEILKAEDVERMVRIYLIASKWSE